ncbi:MAG: KpsF/GutQ family sugar-phosphate isomerase [Oligoflexus sp.]
MTMNNANEGLRAKEIIRYGQEVLAAEAKSLTVAEQRLNGGFALAVEAILKSQGKVVVAGLGKSGHVGRKIAATLASTGTPSFFMHPAEALHGDLGMLSKEDCLLAIAFGGETQETLSVASFARRQGLTVLVLTGRPDSSLAKLADIVLDGSVEKEACPLNLAPTTSTTLALAIGDALAVALMRARGFAESDFAQYHPAGSLGRKLSLVQDYMKPDILSLKVEDGFHRILEVITANNYGIAAVVNDKRELVGAITDGDLRRALVRAEAAVFQLTAGELMSQNPKRIQAQTLALDAVRYMEQHHITTLFVVGENNRQLQGILRMYDLLEAKVV